MTHIDTAIDTTIDFDIGLALIQSQKASYISPPNPPVGCVLTSADGKLIAQGHTQAVGGSHAEVMALRDAVANGESTVGSTAYVTLEPCSHFGRTPPCCNALIEAKVAKVVIAQLDPNPLVAGKGVDILRKAGIEVEVLPTDHPQAKAAKEISIGYLSRMVRKMPWVRVKIAASLDGRTALTNGQSQWITSSEARDDGHAWRARAGAILTGIGTILADDPSLDVRAVPTQRQPHVVIVDNELRTPPTAKVFSAKRLSAEGFEAKINAINSIATQATNTLANSKKQHQTVFIYTNSADLIKKNALEAAGAVVIALPDSQASGKVDLRLMMLDLAKREVNELHVEAGATLNGALMDAGLVDEFLVYIAPKLMGAGRGMADIAPLNRLQDAQSLDFISVEKVGQDLRLIARILGRDSF
jgi:diaminohydroxyphosphoribosylaminopyrimidine deaminase / 5-amino-6-(5-phosphoribosylamino)uracil reductase